MALPDTPIELPQVRRRHRRDRIYAALAAVTIGAAAALWAVELTTRSVPYSGLALMASMIAVLLTVAWLIASLERRMVLHLHRIEGARYRDGYASGYLDAANRFRDHRHERPSLRPVR